MMIKYKLSEVAKDFGFSNKAISEILGKYLKAPRSNAQALNEDELNVIFESLTQTHQIDDIKRVFELAKAEKEQKTQKQEQEAAKTAAKPAAATRAKLSLLLRLRNSSVT